MSVVWCFKAEIKFLEFLPKNSNGGHKIISCVHEADTYSKVPNKRGAQITVFAKKLINAQVLIWACTVFPHIVSALE